MCLPYPLLDLYVPEGGCLLKGTEKRKSFYFLCACHFHEKVTLGTSCELDSRLQPHPRTLSNARLFSKIFHTSLPSVAVLSFSHSLFHFLSHLYLALFLSQVHFIYFLCWPRGKVYSYSRGDLKSTHRSQNSRYLHLLLLTFISVQTWLLYIRRCE